MNRSDTIQTSAASRWQRGLTLLFIVVAMLLSAGCNKLKARDQMVKGVQSYKSANYEAAIEHFKNAIVLDPGLLNAHLYLATAYAQQYIPGVDNPDNNKFGEQAISEYKSVLERDPKNVTGVKSIAYLYMNMKRFNDSKEYYRKAIELDPNDPEAYYSVAVIDWTQAYQPRMEERAKLGLKPTDMLKDKKVCALLKDKNAEVVKDGIEMLNKAIQLRPDYDDAMAYTNLMYREKADLECDDPQQQAADIQTANDWVDKTMATKKKNAEKKTGPGGIVLDEPKQ